MSSKPKVLICDQMADSAIEAMKKFFDVDVKIGQSPEELEANIGPYNAVVVRSATKVRIPAIDAAAKAGNLKLIVRGGVGIDNIDHEYAKTKGIETRNTPTASTISVAELAFGMMLACAHHIGIGTVSMKKGEWLKKELKGVELAGKTLGVVGIGRIGQAVVSRAKAFEMKSIAYDTWPELYKPGKAPMADVPMVSLNELLEKSNFITLHIPFDPKAGPTLGRDQFMKMKKGVIIVNCARGGTIDEGALLDALNDGTVFAAGLDCFATEPLKDANNPLIAHPRVVLTPHIGASTKEAGDKVGGAVIEVLKDALLKN
ncbi:MAG: 3-phosphoglycerate dehydrogenase [bacterium]|nr:3-phosphoglycerate dehydrogenase [bacterium]